MQAIRGLRGVSALVRRQAADSKTSQRASRLVFVTGPFTHVSMWADVQKQCAARGFESMAVSFQQAKSSEELANDLAARVRGAFPPILIGHSLGSVVIQRYIESFPAERLIFVNPLSASTALERLLKLAGSKSDITLLLRDPAFVETLAGNDEMMREMLPALGKKEIDRGVIEDVLSSPPLYDSNTGVPAFLAYGDRDPLVTSDEAKQLAETYGVYDEDCVQLPGGHLSILREENEQFIKLLLQWID